MPPKDPAVPSQGATSQAFVRVDVEPGPASEDGISLRFKRAHGLSGTGASDPATSDRAVNEIPYESESGRDGRWQVRAAEDAEAHHTSDARAIFVEDSSDGVAWLVVGGRHGLLLVHTESGERVREPYLVLSRALRL